MSLGLWTLFFSLIRLYIKLFVSLPKLIWSIWYGSYSVEYELKVNSVSTIFNSIQSSTFNWKQKTQVDFNDWISALIVFARFWRILRVINGVIVGTKQDSDTRVKHLKKKIAIMKNQEFDNGSLKISLDEVMEENVRLNLLQERLEEDDGRQGSMHQWYQFLILIRIRIN